MATIAQQKLAFSRNLPIMIIWKKYTEKDGNSLYKMFVCTQMLSETDDVEKWRML